jgi:hypothetical protein
MTLWEMATGKPVFQRTVRNGYPLATWSGDGATAAVSLQDGLDLLELPSGVSRFRIPAPAGVGWFAHSADGRLLVGGKSAGREDADKLTVWETATGKQVAVVPAGRAWYWALAPDNRSLITTDDRFLRVWDLATGKDRQRWPMPEAGTDVYGNVYVCPFALTWDGRRAVTIMADGSALLWDLGHAEWLSKDAGAKEFAVWWADLAAEDAGRAYAAIWQLADAPAPAAVAFLRERLKPATAAEFTEVQKRIAELDSDTFEVREKAFQRLKELGDVALPALRTAMDERPPLEMRRRLEQLVSGLKDLIRSPEVLRQVRAVQVLERIASKEARGLLAELAGGMTGAPQTRDANAALQRLSRGSAEP